jgi:hypothetical protein
MENYSGTFHLKEKEYGFKGSEFSQLGLVSKLGNTSRSHEVVN